MKNKQQQKIEEKVKLGLPLTKEEKALYVLYSKKLDMEIVRSN